MEPNESPDTSAIEVDGPNLSRRTVLRYAAALAAGAPFLAKSRALGDIWGGAEPRIASTELAHLSGNVRWSYEAGYYQTSYAAVVAALQKQAPKLTVSLLAEINQVSAVQPIDAIEAGTCDLVTTKNPKFQYLDAFLPKKLIVPLDKYYKQYGWNRYVTPLTTKQSIRDGHIYAVTFYLEGPGIAYRPSVFKKLGIAGPPQTWKEFVKILQVAKKAGKVPMTSGVTPLSFLVMIHNMIWASMDAASIGNIIFGKGKWTDGPAAAAAEAALSLWDQGLIDHDAPSISITAASDRFTAGEAVMSITGTWDFSTMQTAFGQDYGLFTAPSPAAGPRWSLGEDQSQSIPYNSKDPDTAAAVLDFCIRGTGAQVFAKHGNLMATSAALPYEVSQIKVVPVTSPNIGVYLYGWLPIESQNAWMNGFTSVLQGKVTPKAWAAQVQVAWERDLESGSLPALSVRQAIPH